jgi:glucose-6-phosphate 1-epimerase
MPQEKMQVPDIASGRIAGRPVISLSSKEGRSNAVVSQYGAQVLSWHCGGAERLFVSPRSPFEPGRAIRGGIPLIFPQFGTRGGGPRHGFARVRNWSLPSTDDAAGNTVRLTLHDDLESWQAWPHAFEANLEVSLPSEDSLRVELEVRNVGDACASFTTALHTYLRVTDISRVAVIGLQGTGFIDSTRASERRRQDEELLRFDGEVDRIYLQAAPEIILLDEGRPLRVRQSGFVDTVVWNPGAALAATMADLGENGHRHFVCIEAASVETPIELPPGGSWRGSQTLIG